MDLYLIRHTDALPLGVQGLTDDAERPLSEEGQAHAQALGTLLSQRGIHLDKIIASPLLRARATAEGIRRGWQGTAPELAICEDLAPGGKRRKVARFLRQLGGTTVALVGHRPDLNELAAWLIGGKKAQINFAKGGLAHVACDAEPGRGAGALVCLFTPEWLSAS